jgi:hypothetical protein
VPGRPSDPLLAFLRDTIRHRQLSTAIVAARTGIDRAALKRKLGGQEPLFVDEFILLSQVLEVTPEQVGIKAAEEPPAEAKGPRLVVAGADEAEEDADAEGWTPDPMGVAAKQVLRYGYALGVDLFILFDSRQLQGSGVPPSVLGRFPDQLPIKLDARYFEDNRPVFGDSAFTCILSFDALYTCTFPWSSFKQINVLLPVEEARPAPEPEPAPTRAPGPVLRVIK